MKFILGHDSITVFLDGNSYTINKQAQTYNAVLAGVRADDEDKVRDTVNIRKTIETKLTSKSDKIRIDNGSIFYGTREITGLVSSRIFSMIDLGLSVDPMIKFLENLMQNPSKRAVDELFGFLDACRLPITEDGHFLAYKRVRDNYLDVHSGTLDNSVGKVLSMERNLVDEDKNNTCSYGLHFCSYDYLKHFGGARIVVLKINPADVVAIPADYNNSKGRTCHYEVVDELPLNEYKMPATNIVEDYTPEYSSKGDVMVESVDTPNIPASAKLNEFDVKEILRYWETWGHGEDDDLQSEVISDICDDFDISRRQAWRIVKREAWKHVSF